jgi:hypothetical protein
MMDRLLRALLLMGAAHRLAIDGDDLGWRLGQRRDPGDEAALERLRIERGENIAQMIMCGRAVAIGHPSTGSGPAQEIELLFAETGDVGKRLGPRQNREPAQEQDFIAWIGDLSGLPMIRHVLEIMEKHNRLGESIDIPGAPVHRNPPSANQRISTDSASQPLVTNFFTRLPWEKGGPLLTKLSPDNAI